MALSRGSRFESAYESARTAPGLDPVVWLPIDGIRGSARSTRGPGQSRAVPSPASSGLPAVLVAGEVLKIPPSAALYRAGAGAASRVRGQRDSTGVPGGIHAESVLTAAGEIVSPGVAGPRHHTAWKPEAWIGFV